MPRGPKGKKRPADVIGNAVKIMGIATEEEPEDYGPEDTKGPGRQGALGKKGGRGARGQVVKSRANRDRPKRCDR
jgi:hypothetical protein